MHPFAREGGNHTARSRVDLCLSNLPDIELSPVEIVDNIDISGAEHNVIFVDIPLTTWMARTPTSSKVMCTHRLKQDEYVDRYQAAMIRHFANSDYHFWLLWQLFENRSLEREEQANAIEWMDDVFTNGMREVSLETTDKAPYWKNDLVL